MNNYLTVTAKMLKSILNTGNIEQVKSMQLFIVDDIYLYSYKTLIGIYDNGVWNVTTQYYSITTSKQINSFNKLQNYSINRITEDKLKEDYIKLKYNQ